MSRELVAVSKKSRILIESRLASCTRRGRLSRNTIAVGIVILDSMRQKCPLEKSDIISRGGEIKGARSGLPTTLAKYGIAGFLKEATTRQVHQDGQRLLDALQYGKIFQDLAKHERDSALSDLIDMLLGEAGAWLARQHLRVLCNRQLSPGAWVGEILDVARGRSGGRVEQHLVGAKLAKAHPDADVPVHPGAAGDTQTHRAGDFQVGTTVYHVTAAPGEAVIRKCKANFQAGLHPVLLIPARERGRTEIRADDLGMSGRVTIMAIEDFFSVNIIELSGGQRQQFLEVLKGIVDEYNRRVEEAETDKSLKIDLE